MDSTFTRSIVGFVVLTIAVFLLSSTALWVTTAYGITHWVINGVIILVALVAEISIYMTTLHEPIYSWIKEPARRKAAARAAEENARRSKQ